MQFHLRRARRQCGRNSTILIWGADGKPKGASSAADALLTKVAASPDGKLAIAADYQGRLVVCSGTATLACVPSGSHP
ncbi:MAG: hypothetical protein LAQ69_01720 [Acidobacteriia bacterium]|nr:hypothetical protein [Terriglobia bacterium]